jgi:hypothetical protein
MAAEAAGRNVRQHTPMWVPSVPEARARRLASAGAYTARKTHKLVEGGLNVPSR